MWVTMLSKTVVDIVRRESGENEPFGVLGKFKSRKFFPRDFLRAFLIHWFTFVRCSLTPLGQDSAWIGDH